jgi:hypothetical protein
LLADGEFHDYEVVMRALLPLVPPQLAIRQIEADRARQHYNREPNEPAPPRTVPRETDRAIVIGSRAIVRKTLTDSAHLEIVPRGRLSPAGTIKQIRYEPGVSRRPGGKRS